MSSMIDTQMDPGVQVFISLRPRALKSRQSNLPLDFKPSYLPIACSQQQQKQNEHKKYCTLPSTKLALLAQGKTVLSISEPCCQPAPSRALVRTASPCGKLLQRTPTWRPPASPNVLSCLGLTSGVPQLLDGCYSFLV